LQVEDAFVSNLPLTMANDQNATQARRHIHNRGRRSPDRRSPDRRGPERRTHDRPAPSQTPSETGSRESSVDVEQIMREIRSKIPTRHGIELTRAQVQELAARRLDAILEPRHVKPELMEQLRRAAGEPVAVPAAPVPDVAPELDEAALFSSHRAGLRRIRGWLKPILKLFFNPAPLIEAVNAENRRAHAAAAREGELHTRQAQWNALHYEVLQRLVLEVSRASIEAQQLSMQVEALSGKIDFTERRLRSLEQAMHTGKPASRVSEPRAAEPRAAEPRAGEPRAAEPPSSTDAAAPSGAATPADSSAEGTRRRRRRRRGRRPGLAVIEGGAMPADADRLEAEDGDNDVEENGDAEGEAPAFADEAASLELPHSMSLVQPVERHPVPEPEPDPGPSSDPHTAASHEAAVLPAERPAESLPQTGDTPTAGQGDREPPDR
jgi:hypothetical protein